MNHSSDRQSGESGAEQHLTEGACRALLNDLLSPSEKRSALSHIAACPRCEAAFQERVAERERLRSSFALRHGPPGDVSVEKLHARAGDQQRASDGVGDEQPFADRAEVERAGGRRPRFSVIDTLTSLWGGLQAGVGRARYRYAFGTMAVAAVLVVLVWPDQRGGDDTLRWLPVAPGGLQVRAGEQATANHDITAGIDAYANRQLDTAIDRLQKAETTGQLETLRRIYLANALARSGRYHEAVLLLESVRPQTLPDPWGSESLWTLYVSLRESGRETAADSLLRILATERGEVGERARKLHRR